MSRLESEVQKLVSESGFKLLDYSQIHRNGTTQLRLVCDCELGSISVDDCATLTRDLRHLIQEMKLLDGDFRLEVSSPGLDYPLREEWQFKKNIGRLLKLTTPGPKGPKELSGRLRSYDGETLELEVGKQSHKLMRAEVLSAVVLPEFKSPLESKR
ncbi:hypothetical protein IT157_07145 [bacterium]|nr:hypothetical protein [bacterium]